MDKFKVYLYKCDPTNISGDIATALFALFVQLPFNIFSFVLQLLVYILKILNLGDVLQGLQASMISASKTVFLSLLGSDGLSIGKTSLVGLAVLIMAGYLLYQFTNGKGHFISTLCHFAMVFALVFFYFGNFSGGKVQPESGGQFLFQTVQNITDAGQKEISKALDPTLGSSDPTTVFTQYLKETANYINTGNVDGKLKDKSTFDYDKASGDDGQSYVDDTSDDDVYLKANNDVLVQKITFGLSETLNAYVMVLPMAVVAILISVLNLVLLLLILLFPVTAALSFFPFFRNAAMNGLKKMLLLVALPAGLSILLSLILYLLGQVNAPVQKAVELAKVPASFSFLVTIIVELLIKAILLIAIWKYRESVLDFLTGGNVSDMGAGEQIARQLRNVRDKSWSAGETVVNGTKDFAGSTVGKVALVGGGVLGAFSVGEAFMNDEKPKQPEQPQTPGPLKPESSDTPMNDENSGQDNATVDPLVQEKESSEKVTESSVEKEKDTETFEDYQTDESEASETTRDNQETFMLPEEQTEQANELSPWQSVDSEPQGVSNPILSEEDSGEWQGAIQDMNALREEES